MRSSSLRRGTVPEGPTPGLRAPGFQLSDSVAAQTIELADRQQNLAVEMIFQIVQFERRSAQASELLAQPWGCQGLSFRLRERHR